MKAKVVILKHRETKKGYPLAIRLSQKNKESYKSLGIHVQPIDWDHTNNRLKFVVPTSDDHPNFEKYRNYKNTKAFIDEKQKQYDQKIEDLARTGRPFTFDKVISEVDNPVQEATTVFTFIDVLVSEMRAAERYGNAKVYLEAKARISDYSGGRDLMFYEMDDNFLIELRNHLYKTGNSDPTVGKILSKIRAVYNEAIRRGIARQNDYPFKKNKDIMVGLSTHTFKSRSISKKYIDALRELGPDKVPQGSDLWHARNYFMVGYLGNGINFSDIARMNWENPTVDWSDGYILDGRVYYVRFKTRRSVKTVQSFQINEELQLIFNYYRWYWRKAKQLNNPYVFPIFNGFHAQKESSRHNAIHRGISQVNKSLKVLGDMIGSPQKTYYLCVETFARQGDG